MLQKKPRIQPMSWSLTTLLLAACGGGGGGGTPIIHSRDGANASLASNATPPVDVIFVGAPGSRYSGPIAENSQRFVLKQAVSEAVSSQTNSANLSIDRVDWTSPQKGVATVSGNTASGERFSVPVEFLIGGRDADHIEFVSMDAKGQLVLQFRSNPDYEQPLDNNQDNIYEFSIIGRYGSNVATLNYQLHVTDTKDGPTIVPSPAGRSSVPAHTREGNVIKITIQEGNTEIFLINTDRFSTFAQNLITGPDADKFEIDIVNVQGQRQTVIKFKDAPSTDAPTDVGGDNIYNFELDGAAEDIYEAISFEITVIDNPNEIL